MYVSKIWLFVVTLAGAIALTIALILPRPAQRALVRGTNDRLAVACGVVRIELETYARSRVELVGSFARNDGIVKELGDATGAAALDDARMKRVRDLGVKLLKDPGVKRPPDFAWLLDKRGRVVARAGLDDTEFADVLAGRPLVDDALAGYLRDDVWIVDGNPYFVAASPVVRREATDPLKVYVGAVVLGHAITTALAQDLAKPMKVELGFFTGNKDAISQTVEFSRDELAGDAGLRALTGADINRDCETWGTPDADHPSLHPALDLHAGTDTYTAVLARLPGEVQGRGAFYAVFVKPPVALGLKGTLFGSGGTSVKKEDLSFSNFPWIVVGVLFVIVLAVGIALMWLEADRPVRRLAADASQLATGKAERLAEDGHRGRYGSIARQINIHIDKLGRDAKNARTNLDQLLGPAPEGGLGTIDLLAGALPPRPGSQPQAPPPPSDFRFGDSGPTPAPRPPPRPQTQPGARPAIPTPPPMPGRAMAQPPERIDEDILGAALPDPVSPGMDPYFKQVYDQFLAVKKSCNEQTTGLTYEKFAEKLVKNRDDLMHKTGCREVRFTVYVKDGKAALKATPVKEE